MCAGGFNKAKSISKQCVCIIRNQAVLTSRSHITEKYVVLPYRDLHCAFASLQGDAQRIWAYDMVHVAWEIPKPPASLQTRNRNLQHRCGIHCFPGETTPSYVEHFDSAFLLQCDCPGRLHAWFFELLGAGPSDWCKPIETTSISIVLLHRRRPQHGLTPNCTKLDDLHINCAMQVIAREMDPQHRLLGRLGDDSQ